MLSLHEFCYWLQGAIEIGGLKEVTPEHAALIYERLEMVNARHPFLLGMRTIMDNYPLDLAFPAISAALQKVFRHDVDASYEGNQEFLQAVHDGKGAS